MMLTSVRYRQYDIFDGSLIRWHGGSEYLTTCQSLRLVCRGFSDHHLLLAALFHNFYLYRDQRSMDNLAALSRSPTLRIHVRRVVFMTAQFFAEHVEQAGLFDKILKANLDRDMIQDPSNDRFAQSKLTEGRAKITMEDVQKLLDQDFPLYYSKKDIEAATEAYRCGLAEQHQFTEPSVLASVGRWLSKLSNLTLFELRGSDGRHRYGLNGYVTYLGYGKRHTLLYPSDSKDPSYLEKRFPTAQIRTIPCPMTGITLVGDLTLAFQVIRLAGVRHISEFALSGKAQLPSSIPIDHEISSWTESDWNRIGGLKSLQLRLDGGYLPQTTRAAYNVFVIPLLMRSVKTLTCLKLGSGRLHEYGSGGHGLDQVVQLRFMNLRSFDAKGLFVSNGHALARFMRDHGRCSEWRMRYISMSMRYWPAIIDALARYCSSTRFIFHGHDLPKYEKGIFGTTSVEWRIDRDLNLAPDVDEVHAVRDYIWGLCSWKQEWTNRFEHPLDSTWDV